MKILNFGSLNIDRVYRVPHLVKPGETIASEGFQCFPGGKGLNQSVAAARAGVEVYHAGTVGQDGGFLIDTLRAGGADTRFVRQTEGVTGHAVIQVSGQGENCIVLFPGCNQENDRAFVDEVLAHFAAGDILILQNEINNLDYLLAKGQKMGMRIMLNPSPMEPVLAQLDFSGVAWLMLNETEGFELTGEKEPDRVIDRILEKYPHMQVILTLGEQGAVYGAAGERFRQPAVAVKAVDTTAAGDTFTGYFAAAMAEGLSATRGMVLAAYAAAIAVSKNGAAVSIPERRAVEELLSAQQ